MFKEIGKYYNERYRKDILLLTVLSSIFILVKYSVLGITRHPEMYMIVRYLPDSFLDMLASFFRKYPPGGAMYRPLPIYILPYFEFKLFQFNHHAWLVIGLILSNMLIILCYILVKLITKNSISAFFSALFFFSYYNKIHLNVEANHFNAEYLYLNFYLMSLICFILYIARKDRLYIVLSVFSFVLALMSKEASATLPVVLIVYLLTYKYEWVKESYDKIKEIISTTPLDVKKYLSILKDKRFLFAHLLPHFMVYSIYILLRVIVPLINENFNTQGGASGLALNFKYIIMNIINIFFYTSQIPLFFQLHENWSYIFDFWHEMFRPNAFLNILMIGIAIVSVVMAIHQTRGKNKTILFGFVFYITNISMFVFFRAFVLGQFHILLSFIGISIIFAESIGVIYHKLSHIKLFLKSTASFNLFFLTVFFLAYAYNGRVRFINAFESEKTVRLFQTIYEVLPKVEDRKPNTIIYIKNSKMIVEKEGYDFFEMCILPAYKGKENVIMCQEFIIDYWLPKFKQCNIKDSNIIVLRYMDEYKIEDITNSSTVKEVQRYLGDYPSYYDEGEFIPFSSSPYVEWNMDSEDEILGSNEGYNVESFNTKIIEGFFGKGRYFNGKDSHIKTPISFQGWKGLTISFWVMPEYIDGERLSAILDNGHNTTANFVIQSNGPGGDKWVWHCNGNDISLPLSVGRWNHIVISADTSKGFIQAYIDGVKVGAVETGPFAFGPTTLTIGRLALTEDRYFKGSIDEIKIWDKGI